MHAKYLSLVVLAAVCGGCRKQDPFVGVWKGIYTNAGATYQLTQTNSADGTFKCHVRSGKGTGGKALIVDDQGTWKKLSDSSVEERVTDTMWTTEGTTAAVKANVEARFNQNKAQIIEATNKKPVKTLKWEGNDQYTETDSMHSVTFHRSS